MQDKGGEGEGLAGMGACGVGIGGRGAGADVVLRCTEYKSDPRVPCCTAQCILSPLLIATAHHV